MSEVKVDVKLDEAESIAVPVPIVDNVVPSGGKAGQVLTKKSDKPFDVEWQEVEGGGSGGGADEERVREIVAEETADLQPKTDESLQTESKEIVGAINEVKVVAETAKMVFGETEGTAYEGNKGKANADNIEKFQDALSIVNLTLEQSGLLKKYKQPITQEYNERVTADGLNVLDGSRAILKKVVGSTVACKNYFNAKVATVGAETTQTAFISNVSQGSVTVKTVSGYIGLGLAYTNKTLAEYCPKLKVGQTVYFNADISGEPFQKALYLSGVGIYWAVGTSQTITQEMLNAGVAFIGLRSNVDSSNVGEVTYSNIRITESNTEPYQPYFTGLKSASFGGIESGGSNLFNALAIAPQAENTTAWIKSVTENEIIIENKIAYVVYTQKTIKELCPRLKVGDIVYLNADASVSGFNLYGDDKSTAWLFGQSKTIEEWMLDADTAFTMQNTPATHYVRNMRITVGQNTPFAPYIAETFHFPKTETPLGTTIDFENKKITDYGVDLVLTGNEAWTYHWNLYINKNGCLAFLAIGNSSSYPSLVSTDSVGAKDAATEGIAITAARLYWYGILDVLGFTTAGTQATAEEQANALANFKAYLTQRYADGNPVTIRYVSSTLQSETDFTAANLYTTWKNGTESVIDNDNAEYGADNTLTQNYILVTEVK